MKVNKLTHVAERPETPEPITATFMIVVREEDCDQRVEDDATLMASAG